LVACSDLTPQCFWFSAACRGQRSRQNRFKEQRATTIMALHKTRMQQLTALSVLEKHAWNTLQCRVYTRGSQPLF